MYLIYEQSFAVNVYLKNQTMNRRKFIRNSALSAGIISFPSFTSSSIPSMFWKKATDEVVLGSTGLKVTRMAIGTGTSGWNRQSNQTRKLGIQGLASLLHYAYEQGIRFWDSADQYGTHPHLREALKYVPREKIVILTKTHASTRAEMKADLDRFRSEIGTDFIDIVLLHCMLDENWPEKKKGAMEYLSEAREKGIIKAHGVSCHTLKALKTAASSDWVQIDLARINPTGDNMDADVSTVIPILKKMKSDGKGIIGMKIFGGGTLTNRVDECLQFILNQNYVDSFTIGIESKTQLEEILRKIPELS